MALSNNPSQSGINPTTSLFTEEKYKEAIDPLQPKRATYPTALVLIGTIIPFPITLGVITATLYITQPVWTIIPTIPTKALVLVVGLVSTLILWLLVSWPFKAFTTFDTANPQSANHLRRHILAQQSLLRLLKEQVVSSAQTDEGGKALRSFKDAIPQDYSIAFDTVCECLAAINERVAKGNLLWIMGDGYIGTWNFVHRAEEAMLVIAPREYVIKEALHDEAAIDGSTIAKYDYVLSNIKTAVKTLSPSAAVYLKSLPLQDRMTAPDTNAAANNSSAQPPAQPPALNPATELEARIALCDARQILNEFRSNLWEGLITIRNLMVGTALITTLLTYVLLCVAISADINAASLKAAIIFYLVGAIVGLFNRLYTESQNDNAIDDYGLTAARVIVTPLLSGLAALAGVLIVAVLSIDILNAPGTAPATGLPQLRNVYDIVQNRQGIVIAALFGLTPNLIINILQQKANDATAKLKNSTTSNQGNS